MEKAKISVIQLFALIVMFDMGTALVINYGSAAKKDAWLAILLGMCGGIVLFFIYYYLFRQYPKLPLTGYARKIFGKYVGWIIGLLYTLFFLYNAARNVRGFGDLLLTSTLPRTPLLALNILMVLAICYVLYLGIEVLARTAEIFIVILIFLGFAGNILVLVSGNIDVKNLQPFLEHGWKPIVTTAFPEIISLPFAQMFVFAMLLPYLNRPDLVKKVWLSALILSGLVLSYTTSLNIAVLGVDNVARSTFPLLSTIGKVNLFEFIQRLDALVVFTYLVTIFFKASIFLYGAVIGMVDLFKIKNHQQILFPIGAILIILSMTIAADYPEYIEEWANVATPYFVIPLFMIIPLLMVLVAMIRNRFNQQAKSKKEEG